MQNTNHLHGQVVKAFASVAGGRGLNPGLAIPVIHIPEYSDFPAQTLDVMGPVLALVGPESMYSAC